MESQFENLSPECHQTQALIDGCLEGDVLDAQNQGFLQAHLTQCGYCRKYELAMRNLMGSLKDLAELPTPPDLVDKIMNRVAQATSVTGEPGKVIAMPARPKANAWLQARTVAPIAAAVMLLLVGGTLLTKNPLMNPILNPSISEAEYSDSYELAEVPQDDFGLPQGLQEAAPDALDHAMNNQQGPIENTPLQNGQLMQNENDVFSNQIGLPTVMVTSITPQDSGNDPDDPLQVMTGF